jgi:hypothetical protein
MGRFTKPLDLYKTQKARFDKVQASGRQMHRMIAEEGYKDWVELVSGDGPSGKARLQVLRALGHPFGRYANASVASAARAAHAKAGTMVDGKRRGSSASDRKSLGLKGELPLLPIGVITGRLRRSIRIKPSSVSPQQFKVGAFNPGKSGFALLDGGTVKVVSRGINAEVRKRFRARNKAFYDHMRQRQQAP